MNQTFAAQIYRLVQGIRGERVFEKLNELERTQWYSYAEIKALQWNKIKRIIEHAYYNVPYYREKFKREKFSPDDLKTWADVVRVPILTKEELRESSLNLIAKDRRYMFSRDSTSGSSGPATIVFTDRNASAFQHAAVFRAHRWMGLTIASKTARFWGTQLDFKRRAIDMLRDALLNRITFSTHALSEKAMYQYYDQLRKFNPNIIYGFTSAIHQFADFVWEKKLNTHKNNIKAVLATGEPLFTYQREFVERVLKSRVYVEYGCAEFGPIAYECPHAKLHLMAENSYVEIECDGQFSAEGKGDLILTELNNFGMPIIRYKIGDVGVVSNATCECGRGLPQIEEISGRSIDFIKTPDGRIIHGIYFDYLPKYFLGEIKQFQVIQEDNYTIRINVAKNSKFSQNTVLRLKEKLRDVLGNEMVINIDSSGMMLREKTGKLRFVVSRITS